VAFGDPDPTFPVGQSCGLPKLGGVARVQDGGIPRFGVNLQQIAAKGVNGQKVIAAQG
jgi:hypothetical protein